MSLTSAPTTARCCEDCGLGYGCLQPITVDDIVLDAAVAMPTITIACCGATADDQSVLRSNGATRQPRAFAIAIARGSWTFWDILHFSAGRIAAARFASTVLPTPGRRDLQRHNPRVITWTRIVDRRCHQDRVDNLYLV